MDKNAKPFKLDAISIIILRGIDNHDSMDEIREQIRDFRRKSGVAEEALEFKSIGSVFSRVTKLQNAGLVEPPPREKQARSRTLTATGRETLEGYEVKNNAKSNRNPS